MTITANPCHACGKTPELKAVQTATGTRLFYSCPTCPQPVEGYHLRGSATEAAIDWNERSEEVRPASPVPDEDSPLMKSVLADARFLVGLLTGTEKSADAETLRRIRRMLDNGSTDLFFGALVLATGLTDAKLLPPTRKAHHGQTSNL